mgnify:CR=1 FL=1
MSAGNDFRLGACEAPPAIISTYLGETMTAYLDEFRKSKAGKEYAPAVKTVDLGLQSSRGPRRSSHLSCQPQTVLV